jgi:hypothetical protein
LYRDKILELQHKGQTDPGGFAAMPRKRTSNLPVKRRIRLESRRDIQAEMGKRYVAAQHGELDRSDLTRDIFALDKIRAGIPETVDAEVVQCIGDIVIMPIAAGTFFDRAAIGHLAKTRQLPPGAVTPLIDPNAPSDPHIPEPQIEAPSEPGDAKSSEVKEYSIDTNIVRLPVAER